MKLSLIEDTITIKKDEIKLKNEENEDLKKQKVKINENLYKMRKNKEKYIISKINSDTKNNDEYLSRAVEQELNLTNTQMKNLEKDANKVYNKFKYKSIKKIIHSRSNKFLTKQGINIIQKDENFKNELNTNKKNINISLKKVLIFIKIIMLLSILKKEIFIGIIQNFFEINIFNKLNI